jgi:hypothetical protein
VKSNNDFTNSQRPINRQIIDGSSLHPAWRAFIFYCRELQHGEIASLRIQDGLPVIAEVTKRKIKFAP